MSVKTEPPRGSAANVIIRRALPADLAGAAKLAARLLAMHHEADPGRFFGVADAQGGYEDWFRQELKRREAAVIVAVQEEAAAELAIVGYAYGTLEGRDWNALLDRHGAIHDIYVDERGRTRGTGRRLIEALVEALAALGAPRFVLSTMVSNLPAQRLFASAGFRPTMLEMTRGG